MLPSTSPATKVVVDDHDIESINSLYSATSTNPEEDHDDDSFHCQYTESAILIDGVSTPSYCRSNASPRSFLFPLSVDVGQSITSSNASDASNVATAANSSNESMASSTTTNHRDERQTSNSTLGPSNSSNFTNHATVGTSLWGSDELLTSMRVETGAPPSTVVHTSSYMYEDTSVSHVTPFALPTADSNATSLGFGDQPPVTTNTNNTAPQFYFDDDQYEEHVNIWASRVWTSSSGKEEDLESFLQAMENARGQLAQQHSFKHDSHASIASTSSRVAWLHAIAELPEVPHHLTRPPPSSPSVFGPLNMSDESSSILSPVFQAKLTNGSLTWHDRVFLLPHEPLRRALQTIRRLVHVTYLPYDAASLKMPAFFAWFDHLALYIRTQCHVKENVMLPAILGVNPSLRELLVATVKSYDAVLNLLDAVTFFETSMPGAAPDTTAPSPDTPDAANHGEMAWASYVLQLAEYIATMEHILSATLDRDERDFGQALASTFNHESYTRQMQKRIETALSPQAKRVLVPWMLDGCDRFGGTTDDWKWGWWSKCLYNTVWRQYYTTNVVAHLRTLEFGDDFP